MEAFRKNKIAYIIAHRKKVAELYIEHFGRIPLRAKLHDLDKIVMLYLGMNPKTVSRLHRKIVKHHRFIDKPWKMKKGDKIEVILDWQSARYTKPDKPLTARETMAKMYPQTTKYLVGMMNCLNL